MGNCLPKKEDLDTSVVKDFAEPAVPEPTVDGEPEKIIEEEPQLEPEPEPEPESEPEPPVEPAAEETIVEEKPKSFMDKVDAFRDSCCGVSTSAAATTTVETSKEDVVVPTSSKDEEEEEEEEEGDEASTATEKVKEPSSENTDIGSEEPTTTATDSVLEKTSEEVTAPAATATTATATSAPPKFKSPTFKQRRKLKKKLREIEVIEEKKAKGEELTDDQMEKLASKDDVVAHLNTL